MDSGCLIWLISCSGRWARALALESIKSWPRDQTSSCTATAFFSTTCNFSAATRIFFGAALEEHRRLPREVDGGAEVSFETTRLEQQDIADRPGICFRRDRLQRRLWKFPQEPW